VWEDFSNLNSVLTSNFISTESSEELTETKLVQNSPTQINSSEVGITHPGITHPGITEVGSSEIGTIKINFSKVGSSEVGSSEVGTIKTDFSEISITQIDFRKIGASSKLNPTQIDPREVSFPNSIPSEQFFSSHFQIHNSSPQIINVLNNSPTDIDSFDEQNIEPEGIYGIKSTNIPLTNIPDSLWVSSLNPTYTIGDRTVFIRLVHYRP
jgi:hypothetical protein